MRMSHAHSRAWPGFIRKTAQPFAPVRWFVTHTSQPDQSRR
jgi:hypothetical protein